MATVSVDLVARVLLGMSKAMADAVGELKAAAVVEGEKVALKDVVDESVRGAGANLLGDDVVETTESTGSWAEEMDEVSTRTSLESEGSGDDRDVRENVARAPLLCKDGKERRPKPGSCAERKEAGCVNKDIGTDEPKGVVVPACPKEKVATYAVVVAAGDPPRSVASLVEGKLQTSLRAYLRGKGVMVPHSAYRDLAITTYTLMAQPPELLGGAERLRVLSLVGDAAFKTVYYTVKARNVRLDVKALTTGASVALSNASLAKVGSERGFYKYLTQQGEEKPASNRVGATMLEAIVGVLSIYTSTSNVEVFVTAFKLI